METELKQVSWKKGNGGYCAEVTSSFMNKKSHGAREEDKMTCFAHMGLLQFVGAAVSGISRRHKLVLLRWKLVLPVGPHFVYLAGRWDTDACHVEVTHSLAPRR